MQNLAHCWVTEAGINGCAKVVANMSALIGRLEALKEETNSSTACDREGDDSDEMQRQM